MLADTLSLLPINIKGTKAAVYIFMSEATALSLLPIITLYNIILYPLCH